MRRGGEEDDNRRRRRRGNGAGCHVETCTIETRKTDASPRYLAQTRDQHLAAVGADVLVQVEDPLPRLGAGLEDEARDGGAPGLGEGPPQDDAR